MLRSCGVVAGMFIVLCRNRKPPWKKEKHARRETGAEEVREAVV